VCRTASLPLITFENLSVHIDHLQTASGLKLNPHEHISIPGHGLLGSFCVLPRQSQPQGGL
jgi:hypothetical protein